jgi:hypothetical protein
MTTANGQPNNRLDLLEGGKTKVEHYKWGITGKPGQFLMIPKDQLNVDHENYQTSEAQNLILAIASNWSWPACNCLIVSLRPDGTRWVIDGQHRKCAADRRADILDLPCMVFRFASIAEEAAAFLSANANRRRVTTLAKFKAMVTAGDQDAVLAHAIITGNRYQAKKQGNYSFTAVHALMQQIRSDKEVAKVAFKSLADLADGKTFTAQHLNAFCFLERFLRQKDAGTIAEGARLKDLSNVGLTALEAAGVYECNSSPQKKHSIKHFAAAMIDKLNKSKPVKPWPQVFIENL